MTGFNTTAIHAGQEPDAQTGAVTVPVHLATTYAQQGVNQHKGFEYSRTGNPTRQALETSIAALEEGAHGFAFGSGMAAEDAILRLLRPGDNVLLGNDAYGGTFRLLDKIYGNVGVTWTAVDLTKPDLVASNWTDTTRMIWLETPTNPNLTVFDIEAISAAAHLHGGICVVDNTFATPYLQQPIALGADIVVHSATKYLGGHSDVVGGLAVTDDDELATHLGFTQNATGAVISPFDCYLLLRGLKISVSAWTDTVTTLRRSSQCWPSTPPSNGCSIPDWPAISGTRSLPSRCATSAAWSRSCPEAEWRPPTASSPPPSSSRSPSRSERSSH